MIAVVGQTVVMVDVAGGVGVHGGPGQSRDGVDQAVLRLDPIAFLPLKKFDFDGECHVFFERQPVSVEIFELFFQAVSMADEVKFCTSELMWLRTDLAGHWEFQNRN